MMDYHNLPPRDIRFILRHIKGASYLGTGDDLSPQEATQFKEGIARRLQGEPLSKIVGERAFWEHTFFITHDTLDPRPESELLIEAVLRRFPEKNEPLRILDLGTGSGCLILSLLFEYPYALGWGVDISVKALEIAIKNATRLSVNDRFWAIHGSWCTGLTGSWDLVVSNPPYIGLGEELPEDVLDYDPLQSLFSGESGFEAYDAILESLSNISVPRVFFEMGYTQSEELQHRCLQKGWRVDGVYHDFSNIPRVLEISHNV